MMATSLLSGYSLPFSSLPFPLVENFYEGNLALLKHWPDLDQQSTLLLRGNLFAATNYHVEIM